MVKEADFWNATLYTHNASFVSENAKEILTWLAPQAGEKILDLGCGEGSLAAQLKAQGVHVLGVDASAAMVESAKEKGVEAQVMDARSLPFVETFDAVFSNATLHWVKPPEIAVEGIYRALKPKGRFVAEFGGKRNVVTLHTALISAVSKRGEEGDSLDPWYFPAAEDYQLLLEANGFFVKECLIVSRPTWLPTGVEGWLETFAAPFLAPFSPEERKAITAEVIETVRPLLWREQGGWFADYRRIRVKALKK